MGKAQGLKEWATRLLFPPRPAGPWGLLKGADGPLLWSGDRGARPLFITAGFGSSLYDYAPLAEIFGQHQRVYRVGHPGSDRRASLAAGARLLWHLHVERCDRLEAARRVRRFLHREASRQRRLAQLCAAVNLVREREEAATIDLAGHSYGTDTALLFALRNGHEVPIDTLYLFSPHPPGYLIPLPAYRSLRVRRVVVVVGSKDRTRDGVGPEERRLVAEAVGDKGRLIWLEGVGHMDFAFPGMGPKGWPRQLGDELSL